MDAAVAACAKMLLEREVASIKMTDVADECDIGVASLYRYFGTKSAMVLKAACLIWRDVRQLFDGVFECDYYEDKTGIEQLHELMKVFRVLYLSHGDFLRFVGDLDRFVIKNKVPADVLTEYQASLLNFYPLFESAFAKGVNDGTVRDDVDFPTLYLAVTHAMMLMGEKFSQPSVFENENVTSEKELELMIDMAISYVSAR
ncbi:transcriptional regulator, TetR family [Ruminococcus sp. YE71]|uniref:TetR/AcrR family transcriptional regulator n=1 Tax=unclassified Ruminococcus TaxID=2608920 RepID=UPI00088C5A6C|nr:MULTISPECIES: TetR/AcrR family transcriptional regulator [unclassified Ruminococcus]SDA17597.1 transcriptional regulator, TetR family [Ruminococcus sp. YE78]SFW27088.1 transcriptional regulator, TetR family [Ruminococcus sp. YE71]